MEPVEGDALGTALLDALDGRAPSVVIERDDGFVDVDGWEASFAGRGSTYAVILTRQEITNG